MATPHFSWLIDLHKSQCYTTGDWTKPSKSIDLGDAGHTASLTDWNELLQLTVPDPLCGIVFVRGDFPNTADAILARAQHRDDTSHNGTFGLRIDPKGSVFELGERRDQGFVNFRWPYIQYELMKKTSDGGVEQIGIYETISFVKDGVVFQAVCIRYGYGRAHKMLRGAAEHIKIRTQDQAEAHATGNKERRKTDLKKEKIRLKVGGYVQFGCPCSNALLHEDEVNESSTHDIQKVESWDHGKRLTCISSRYQKRLEMQLFVNGDPKEITLSSLTPQTQDKDPRGNGLGVDSTGNKVDLASTHSVELLPGRPTIIVATYALRDSSGIGSMLKADAFESLEDHLGISNDSEKMSDRLWTACLTSNYEAVEAVEFCAIATAVEQTLCVSSVPVDILRAVKNPNQNTSEENPKAAHDQYPTATALGSNQDNTGIALVRNIISGQYVDLQSTFWQIRLLVKVHQFLRSRRFEPDLLDAVRPLDDIRDFYLKSLQDHIRRVLFWLLEANVEPGKIMLPVEMKNDMDALEDGATSERSKSCLGRCNFIKVDNSFNQACFVTLAVWFVMKHCPEAILDVKAQFILPALGKLYKSGENQDSRGETDSTPKSDVLQWFHLSCFLLICQESYGKDKSGNDIDGFAISGLNRHDISRAQKRCEKLITRLRKNKAESYLVEDEEVDRLFLLGEELGFNLLRSPATSSLVVARAKQSRAKATERKPTTRFNPGPRPSKIGDVTRVESNGPWELICLNHHTLLRTTLDPSSDISVQACRDACFEFLLSNYSFMSSWDRADKSMVDKWWDFETGSVICATLLDLKVEGKLKAADPEPNIEDLNKSMMESTVLPNEVEERINPTTTLQGDSVPVDTLRDLLLQLKQELIQSDSGSSLSIKAFDWLSWKPALYYHPMSWVQSLSVATKVSKPKPIKKLRGQNDLIKYFSRGDKGNQHHPLEWHMKQIGEVLLDDLDYISVFDLVINYDFAIRSKEISFRNASWRSTTNVPPSSHNQDLSAGSSGLVQSPQEMSLAILNRNLVDSGIQYRILFAERCCPSLVKAFICGWHPDALDTFDNYFGSSSQFSNNREAVWTTTITISHWSIRPIKLPKARAERFQEGRIKGDFPPQSIANLGLEEAREPGRVTSDKPAETVEVEERSSSLVITGDPQGFFWVCTVWSSLTKHKALASSVNSLAPVLQHFIHQKVSGRCLVFLILLGHLCEKLAEEYEIMLAQLTAAVDLGEKILMEGLQLEGHNAVHRLEKMLWGLEALRVFDDRLSSSLSQIRKAKETLEHTIDQEAGQHDIELLQEYKNVLDEFGKRYGILSDVQVRIQLRIRQVSGLRDGISAVTNVIDSRTALSDSRTTIRQGNNIRVLTLITIAYLPLGFVTGLFSVTHGILPDDAGTSLYVVLVFAFMIVTYAVALCLGLILDIVQPRWRRLKARILPIARAESLGPEVHKPAPRDRSRRGRYWPEGTQMGGNVFHLTRINGLDQLDVDMAV